MTLTPPPPYTHQLSIQLQQSSEYWSQKVRELSIELERLKEHLPQKGED